MASKKKEKAPFDLIAAETEHASILGELNEVEVEINKTNAWGKKTVAAKKLFKKRSTLLERVHELEDSIKEGKKTPKERKLEIQFKEALKESQKQVDIHLKAAMAELKKAFAVAEKTGVPFDSGICDTYNTYVPKSFKTKWKDKLSEDFLDDLTYDDLLNLGEDYGEYGGWTQSYC